MSSNWSFNASVVPIFDEHVRKNVPQYDEMHRLITDIAGWFLEDNTNVYDIGTSTGEVVRNLIERYPSKRCSYIATDTSPEMASRCAQRFLESKPHVPVIVKDEDVRSTSFKMEHASLVTCVLTLQFIPKRDRLTVLKKIYESLHKGGGLILVEKVIGENTRFNEMWVELYHELKLRNGMTEEEVFKKSQAIRGVLVPLTLQENVSLLKEAGFTEIDVFFKWTNFVGLIAMKT